MIFAYYSCGKLRVFHVLWMRFSGKECVFWVLLRRETVCVSCFIHKICVYLSRYFRLTSVRSEKTACVSCFIHKICVNFSRYFSPTSVRWEKQRVFRVIFASFPSFFCATSLSEVKTACASRPFLYTIVAENRVCLVFYS